MPPNVGFVQGSWPMYTENELVVDDCREFRDPYPFLSASGVTRLTDRFGAVAIYFPIAME